MMCCAKCNETYQTCCCWEDECPVCTHRFSRCTCAPNRVSLELRHNRDPKAPALVFANYGKLMHVVANHGDLPQQMKAEQVMTGMWLSLDESGWLQVQKVDHYYDHEQEQRNAP